MKWMTYEVIFVIVFGNVSVENLVAVLVEPPVANS